MFSNIVFHPEQAKIYQPTIIFMDEVDALLGHVASTRANEGNARAKALICAHMSGKGPVIICRGVFLRKIILAHAGLKDYIFSHALHNK